MFLALSVPLDSIHHDVSVAYNFEANYAVPTNATALTELQGEYGFRRSQRAAGEGLGLRDDVDVDGHRDQLDGHPRRQPEGNADDSSARPRPLRDVSRAEIYSMVMGSIAR